jgi:hypothetical protein
LQDTEQKTRLAIESSCGLSYKPLGTKRLLYNKIRIRITEYLLLVLNFMKEASEEVEIILSDCISFWKLLFEYLFEFEWNNTYQTHFDNLIRYLTTNSCKYSGLMKTIFEDVRLIEILLSKAKNKFIFKYSLLII